MGRKAQISLVAVVFTAIVAALLVYVWDSTRDDKIAEGVTIGGVDVGGLDADAARTQVETQPRSTRSTRPSPSSTATRSSR